MIGFRLSAQKPPPPRAVTNGVVMRLDHLYEVDPERMGIIAQQEMPVWDSLRIAANRADYLAWMHRHFADTVLSAEEEQPKRVRRRTRHESGTKRLRRR